MKLFNSQTVVGLFDTDQAVEAATAELHKRGFGQEEDEIQILDETRLGYETPLGPVGHGPDAVIPSPGPSGPAGPLVFGEPESAAHDSAAAERMVEELLTDKGLGQEEASFYAQHVRRGSALVIVETSKERAPEALDILKQANARASMA